MEWFHVTHDSLLEGSRVLPGRYGERVLSDEQHPAYEREWQLDSWRLKQKPPIFVSRLAATYAFESHRDALWWVREGAKSRQSPEIIYQVQPAIEEAPRIRLDMAWITFISKTPRLDHRAFDAYWNGLSIAESLDITGTKWNSTWEWLFSCPLLILGKVCSSCS